MLPPCCGLPAPLIPHLAVVFSHRRALPTCGFPAPSIPHPAVVFSHYQARLPAVFQYHRSFTQLWCSRTIQTPLTCGFITPSPPTSHGFLTPTYPHPVVVFWHHLRPDHHFQRRPLSPSSPLLIEHATVVSFLHARQQVMLFGTIISPFIKRNLISHSF
jgi:hypothetical protein